MTAKSSLVSQSRVLLFAEYGVEGGTRTYAKQLIAFYSGLGCNVLVISSSDGHDLDMQAFCSLHQTQLLPYISLARHNPQVYRFPWQYWFKSSKIKKFISSYNPTIIVASVGTPGLFLVDLWGTRPSLYIVHACLTSRFFGVRLAASRLLKRIFIPRSIFFLTVSRYAKDCLQQFWAIPDTRLSHLYSTTGPFPSALCSPTNTLNILSVGNLVPYKNPLTWIRVACSMVAQYPYLTFTWVGSGPLLDYCLEAISECQLKDKIQFVGHSDNCNEFYQRSDIFLHLSLFESLGLSVLDAMRYGLPSVVSRVGGLTETIQAERSGFFVDPLDLDDIQKSLIRLIENQELRLKMGRAASCRYADVFAPEHWHLHLQKFNEHILASRLTSN